LDMVALTLLECRRQPWRGKKKRREWRGRGGTKCLLPFCDQLRRLSVRDNKEKKKGGKEETVLGTFLFGRTRLEKSLALL